jgi:glycine cleavage system aminomethyltransferase T
VGSDGGAVFSRAGSDIAGSGDERRAAIRPGGDGVYLAVAVAGQAVWVVAADMFVAALTDMNTTQWPVRSGADRGKVTSALYSPRPECNIGYLWVPTELAEPGTSSGWTPRSAGVPGQGRPGTVHRAKQTSKAWPPPSAPSGALAQP